MSTTACISRFSKIFSVFAVLALILCSVPQVQAKPGGGFTGPDSAVQQGGFSGPGPALTTVKDAKTMADDAWVILKGNIIQHNGKKMYTFRDATGDIEVEIGRDEWGGQTISPTDLVEIRGEVDKDWNEFYIDVKRVMKVQ